MAAVTACVSVSDGCRPPVFGNDEGSVIDALTLPQELKVFTQD